MFWGNKLSRWVYATRNVCYSKSESNRKDLFCFELPNNEDYNSVKK